MTMSKRPNEPMTFRIQLPKTISATNSRKKNVLRQNDVLTGDLSANRSRFMG